MIGTITGATIGVVALAALIKAHATKPTVPRIGKWLDPPTIAVDPEAPVTVQQVARAARWWRARGYEIGDIVEGIAGIVHIRNGMPPAGHIGRERLQISAAGIMARVHIDLDPRIEELKGPERQAHLRHMFGHILGYVHVETRIMPGVKASKSGHVMAPNGGKKDQGLDPSDEPDLVRMAKELERMARDN